MNQFPIPKNYQETLDMFSFVLLGAPEFKGTPVKYSFALGDVMESLRAGVTAISKQIVNPRAKEMLLKCIEEIHRTQKLFEDGNLSEAYREIQIARDLFREGANSRGGR